MKRRTALARRVFAAFILLIAAVGSVLLWNDGRIDWSDLSINLAAAFAGFVFLHYRWRTQERRAMTPRKVEDIFS